MLLAISEWLPLLCTQWDNRYSLSPN